MSWSIVIAVLWTAALSGGPASRNKNSHRGVPFYGCGEAAHQACCSVFVDRQADCDNNRGSMRGKKWFQFTIKKIGSYTDAGGFSQIPVGQHP